MGKSVTLLQCPQCGSTRVFYEMGGITGMVYHCQTCDYIGPVVIEHELTEEEVQAMEEERSARAQDEGPEETGKGGKRRGLGRARR